jgi:hypothetical protein
MKQHDRQSDLEDLLLTIGAVYRILHACLDAYPLDKIPMKPLKGGIGVPFYSYRSASDL